MECGRGEMEGLEILSTVYWHLKDEVSLSYLARKVSKIDKRNPVTWCVVGNCYSLLKEHELALRFFQRALHLDPGFAYASTLSGHELVANEDFEKAIGCFRDAIRANSRHYNAWYGLGSIYYRQEKVRGGRGAKDGRLEGSDSSNPSATKLSTCHSSLRSSPFAPRSSDWLRSTSRGQ